MEPEKLTPEQKEQLLTWGGQRDSLLNEISALRSEQERLSSENVDLAVSSTDIADRIQQSIGRMSELDKQENDYINIIAAKIPALEVEKSILETKIPTLNKEIEELEVKKQNLEKDIMFLTVNYEEIFSRTGSLEKIVEHVTSVSSSNITELENSVSELTKKVKDILALSESDLKAHTDVLQEIPRLFVELKRKSLVREKLN
jgi:DNA repair exonuclease SbcCD ATPase subunit